MSFLRLSLFLLLSWEVCGQTAFKGTVVDAQTDQPVPFANIGIVGRGIGTVSDMNGKFLLDFPPQRISGTDLVRISSLGYEPIVLSVSLMEEQKDSLLFRMKDEPISLQEVVLTNLPMYQVEEEIGYPGMSGKGIGYWKDSVALGGELASLIRVEKGLRKLNSLFFDVLYNPSDSLKLRLNFYKPMSGPKYPGENLNQSGNNILLTLKKGKSLAVVNLEPYDIWVRDDFIVSMELLQVHGTEKVGLSLPAGSIGSGRSYRRYASQGNWEVLDGSVVGYYFQSTYHTDNPRRLPKPRVVLKQQKNQREISGFVFFAGRPLPGVAVRNYSRNEEVATDARGRYRLKVSKGDVLGISYPGLEPLIVEVEEPKNFNFQMQASQ
ncbi:MAG: carboxypeptidase-like regulatory domain-containing protein [Flavobacteriaceae bacterium]|jgi:hypothetical protein|nr:MAG: carboxypeptidase-like regulatory domain-containing protein [Flavobacteriaceae bacterium]